MPKAQFITVSDAESGQKLLQLLERRLTGDVPRSAIQKWIRKGQVRVDKGRKKPFDRITAGQIVRIPPYTPGESKATVSAGNLVTAYEDDDYMAIAKPAGLAAHGGDKITDSVTARLRSIHSDAEFMPTLAHRLDRDTSGLLLAAKSYEALRTLNDLFASGDVGKLYLAWVEGEWKERETILLEDRMGKKGVPGQEKVRTGKGKTALAKVTGLVSGRRQSLVAVRLITGRTHQIRVQLASRKHPVCGDHKYGKSRDRTAMRLHCYAMQIMEKTITLEPLWSGKWEVPSDALREALSLLYDD
ncbi:pseudouridine synthase [Pseudodesulfovibrio nedwellii]|uniref:Pseudouridine synthase n=1 Tax=Pseudodesulfovibrio nedwellii TaxID=2973072 RepID=A0ABM8B4C6_9BACT|nr:RluA family pseudouridine synthase [Pseudodesulfovibrio nedwellii]BDQ38515.1 pseudouridine synthase [Pseudodesulfovibrio nedwellii]